MDFLTYLVTVFCGHIIGDYFLQPAYLALNKKIKGSFGEYTCLAHCNLYTVTIISSLILISGVLGDRATIHKLILESNGVWFAITIYGTHYLLDRFHFLDWYMSKVGIRSWDTNIRTITNKPIKDKYLSAMQQGIELNTTITKGEAISVAFGAIVYVVMDNFLHILTLILIYPLVK
jgi:hypothetical protein